MANKNIIMTYVYTYVCMYYVLQKLIISNLQTDFYDYKNKQIHLFIYMYVYVLYV